jgi:hypothetical protein
MDREDREHNIRLDFQFFLLHYRMAVAAHARGEDPERVAGLLADAQPFGRTVLSRLLRREPTTDEVEALLQLDRRTAEPT